MMISSIAGSMNPTIIVLGQSTMREAFAALREFFVGASYSVFAAGCVLAILSETVSYLTIVAAFIFALLLLILAWVCAMAGRGLE